MIRVDVATESWRSTLRAMPLRPMLIVVSCLMLLGIVASGRNDALPGVVGVIGAGALAGAVALGLDDEANTMLRSSPSNALARLGLRLMFLGPALLAAVLALVAAERLLFAERSSLPSASALVALATVGIAVEVWWGRRRPETAADGAAVAVMLLVIAPSLVPGIRVIDRLGGAWQTQAPWVIALSVVLVVAGTAGRDA
ncbi:MAG TPA: hypothetical protein VMY16_06670 [Ilumatobacteraceae bacterium]|nr:hypothetical protein [Ilumatobacteraceae bacterium]